MALHTTPDILMMRRRDFGRAVLVGSVAALLTPTLGKKEALKGTSKNPPIKKVS
jgi:hypothetical protein